MKKDLLLQLITMLISDKQDNQLSYTDKEQDTHEDQSDFIGKYVIIRWYYSWVHAGIYVKKKNWSYFLKNSRRLWYWRTKGIDLTSLAQNWLVWDDCKICAKYDGMIEITDNTVCEIIPCTKEAQKSIESYSVFTP